MTPDTAEILRRLPSVDEVLRVDVVAAELEVHPRVLVVESIREALAELRARLREGEPAGPDRAALLADVVSRSRRHLERRARPVLRRVLNATGVVLHTNLGRAILSASARKAVEQVTADYCNLEFNLETGKRGLRYALVEDLLVRLTGAEAAMVVNNNAAAVLLALSTLAAGKEVIVSRGQLVEIGGSFRIPEVMQQGGAHLVEVGTTNKTYQGDYRQAITENTALLLNVHTSNYRIVGFTHETGIDELAALGRETGLPVMCDLGSGFLINLAAYGFPYEPTVQDTVEQGADVVTFSGDKLLGGPQAGIIVGSREIVDRMKRNPLTRALRVDKQTLAALQATLAEYLDPEQARQNIPTLRMLTMPPEQLYRKAEHLAGLLREAVGAHFDITLQKGASRVGGGAMPTAMPETTLVVLEPRGMRVQDLAARLRETDPALVGRVQDLKLMLDPRTLQTAEFTRVARVIQEVLTEESN